MTKFTDDESIKKYLSKIAQNYGQVIPSAQIPSEERDINILFTPDKVAPTSPETLGLLGKILQNTCLIEIFSTSVESEQIRESINKLLKFNLSKTKEKKALEPLFLWIITPTINDKILDDFGATRRQEWNKGIYFTPTGFMTGIIAVHSLEVSKETLWLRILGTGTVQAKAIEELKSLPENHPKREIVLKLIDRFI